MAARRYFPFFAAVSLLLLAPGCSKDEPTKPQASPSPGPTDSSPPMIVVSAPARSAMLKEGTAADGFVSVSGDACDSTGIASLNVLGSPVSVSGHPICAPFDVQEPSRWGLNAITADATSVGGAAGSVVQSYLRSPSYFPPATSPDPDARVPAGTVVQLNQTFLDDYNRSDADDIATIVEKALNAVDWNAQITSPIAISPDADRNNVVDQVTHNCGLFDHTDTATGYIVRKGGAFTRGPITVGYVTAYAGKLWTSITVNSMRLPLDVTGYLNLICLPTQSGNVTGSVLADQVTIAVDQKLHVDPAGKLVSDNPEVQVYFTNLRLDIDWGPLSFISDLLDTITNKTISAFSTNIEDLVANEVRTLMPEMLNTITAPRDFTLQGPTGIAIGMRSIFDSFTVVDAGGTVGALNFSLATQVFPKNPVLGREALPYGAIRKDGASPTFTLSPYSIGVGVKDDAVNQFLWAAWAGGAFDFSAVVGDPCLGTLPGSITSVRAGLPPILMPGRNGHEMEIGLGDLHVEYEAPAMVASLSGGTSSATATASFYVSAVAGVGLSVDNTTHGLKPTLDPNPEIHVQVVNADASLDPAALRAGIEAAVRCLYDQRLASVTAAFPILEMDLTGVPGFTPGAKLGIGGATIERRGDFTVLTGSAEAR